MKEVEVQILHGLPGSGKTYYADSMKQNNEKVNVVSLDQPLFFGNWIEYDTEICIIDGLLLTNKAIIDTIKKVKAYQNKYRKLNIKIISWKENRELCLKNDQYRRKESSKDTIKYAEFEKIDTTKIKNETGYDVTVEEKEIVLKPDYVFCCEGKAIRGLKGDYLFSDSWILSGESRSYDSEWKPCYYRVDGEEPPDFEELYTFLEAYKPDLTALQLRYIQKNLIEFFEFDDDDYYSRLHKAQYKINMKDLLSYIDKDK